MRALAAWLDRSPWRAALGLIGAALLLGVFSSAVLAFVNLRRGPRAALQVALLGALPLFVLGLVQNGSLGLLVFMAATWLLVIAVSELLRVSRSLSLATQTTLAVAAGLLLGAFAVGDPIATATRVLQDVAVEFQRHKLPPLEANNIAAMAPIATGVAMALAALTLLANIYLGRWWQSLLEKPGAFGAEFRQLRLGKALAVLAGIAFVAPLVWPVGAMPNLVIVMIVAFSVQGIAVLHALRLRLKLAEAWLLLVYLPFLLPGMAAIWAVLIACIGYLETWLDWRRRLSEKV